MYSKLDFNPFIMATILSLIMFYSNGIKYRPISTESVN